MRTRRQLGRELVSLLGLAGGLVVGRAAALEVPPAAPAATAARFFVNPYSGAAKWLKENAGSPDAPYMRRIAENMHAVWLGRWNRRIGSATRKILQQHAEQGALPVLVIYNIPGRDNGGYSSGGEDSPETYYHWLSELGAALGESEAIVILEPDALALSPGIKDEQNRAMRYTLVNSALDIVKRQPRARVYLDAGHPNWHPPAEMADLLIKGGIERADGFFVNVSNFVATASCIEYGRAISERTGGAHFVIDTSRNGRGAPADPGEYCNPSGMGLGQLPTLETGEPLCDAFLWIKVPGESDGPCNGGPDAGRFWPEYAIALAKNA